MILFLGIKDKIALLFHSRLLVVVRIGFIYSVGIICMLKSDMVKEQLQMFYLKKANRL